MKYFKIQLIVQNHYFIYKKNQNKNIAWNRPAIVLFLTIQFHCRLSLGEPELRNEKLKLKIKIEKKIIYKYL